MSKEKFLRGAAILAMAALMVKILGSVNRILLSRLLGGEGIGIYQMAYPVYLLLLSISSAGVPIAVSIIVAEHVAKKDYMGAKRIFKVTLGLMAVFGLVFAVVLYNLSDYMISAGFIRDPRAHTALLVLTPAVFFSSILASFRGYFQGHQTMTPPAISQIIEQFVRVTTMVVLAYYLLPYGLEYAAAGAAFGAIPGALTGILVLWFFYNKQSKVWKAQEVLLGTEIINEQKVSDVAKRLIWLALPVSCANLLIPVTSLIDMLLVPNLLGQTGYDVNQATTLFGYLSGMAQPLIMMATIPTVSLAASLVPAISELYTLNDQEEIKKKCITAMFLCCLITIPASVGMYVLAEPISLVLYGTTKAAPVIAGLSPSIALLGIFQVTTGMLQGIGASKIPMWNMLFGSMIRALVLTQLIIMPTINILGAAWASNINFLIIALINVGFLYKHNIKFSFGKTIKIIAASVVMGAITMLTYDHLASFNVVLALVLAMLAAGCSYLFLILMFKIVNKEDLSKLPVVNKIVKKRG